MIELNNTFYILVIIIFLSSIIIHIFNKNNFLIDQVNYSKHKQLTKNLPKSPPLCGGSLIFIFSVLFFKGLTLLKIFGFYRGMNKPLPHLIIECLRWFSLYSISIYHSDSFEFVSPLCKEKPPTENTKKC